eukprot:CAMPEP_0171770426 /NCGR_PEP_ID=MMETSP0991-20121206/53495_1 /TAXON_ID=483369 /ORGANISM="non described non described, Strain CCMP2098" /LENGTH=84 /DNA_ID=CAMNT_0012375579 /DNA_START=136 /DNA_END=390 /DNA_ORIENTATION=-
MTLQHAGSSATVEVEEPPVRRGAVPCALTATTLAALAVALTAVAATAVAFVAVFAAAVLHVATVPPAAATFRGFVALGNAPFFV